MVWPMRAKSKTGLEAMIGKKALVLKTIDLEGKVEIKGEIWTATARNERIVAGETVEIVAATGLVLLVRALDARK